MANPQLKLAEIPEDSDAKLMPAWPKAIRAAMQDELQRAMEWHSSAKSDAAKVTADMMYIIGKWSVRSARKYASDRDDQLRAELVDLNEMLFKRVEELSRSIDVLQARLELEELRRLKLYE